jgi:hypothetical protein
LTKVDLSIGIKRTPQQYGKSNSAAQDDEQHNAALKMMKSQKHKQKT